MIVERKYGTHGCHGTKAKLGVVSESGKKRFVAKSLLFMNIPQTAIQCRGERCRDLLNVGQTIGVTPQRGLWEFYPDEGSSNIVYENNVVYDVHDGTFHQYYGRENTVRNNIFAFSEKGQIAATRAEKHKSFTFERNIVYFDQGQLLGYGGWTHGIEVEMHDNLYWRAKGQPFDFAGKTFEQWQQSGRGKGSIIADPLFIDPAKRDYRLRPNSPAPQIGFVPFDYSKAGVYGTDAWKKLA